MLDRLGSFKPDEPYEDDKLDDITIQHLLDHIPQRRREKKVALPKRGRMPASSEPPHHIARVPERW